MAKPEVEQSNVVSDLEFSWSNKLSFGFEVTRKSMNDVLSQLRARNSFSKTSLSSLQTLPPKNYNVYRLGESIYGFGMGNNYTKTYYNLDAGDRIDVYI